MQPESLSKQYFDVHGFHEVLFFLDASKLGFTCSVYPHPTLQNLLLHFPGMCCYSLAIINLCPETELIDVWDCIKQNREWMPLSKFLKAMKTVPRTKIYNSVSYEVGNTLFGTHITVPNFVKYVSPD